MTGLYLIVILFSALSICFIYKEYRQNRFSQNVFVLACIMETVAIVVTAVVLIMSHK
jgi:hypothetical protein